MSSTPPIDRKRFRALDDALHEWQSPGEMATITRELSKLLENNAMLRVGRSYREGFVAQRFAAWRGASQVRLLAERDDRATPDFEIRLGEHTLRYETTEVDEPDRRRQDEYRDLQYATRPSVSYLDAIDREPILAHMRWITDRKASKAYDDCRGLVVLLNVVTAMVKPSIGWPELLYGSEPASRAFDEVWIWNQSGALLWRAGMPQEGADALETLFGRI